MPNHTKPSRVLSINGQDYLVADSVKNELLLQVLELFSTESLRPVSQDYIYDGNGGYRHFIVEAAEFRHGGGASLAVQRRELIGHEEFVKIQVENDRRRIAADKAREEAAKNGDK